MVRPPSGEAGATTSALPSPDVRDIRDVRDVRTSPANVHIAKVHIIGGPGSGKTTLSLRLADLLGVPVFELDEIAGAGPAPSFRMQHPLSQRLDDVRRIAALPAWIAEGSFLWWTDELLRAADVIIWLDVPPRLALWRVLVRQGRDYRAEIGRQRTLGGLARTLRHPHLGPTISFVSYTWKYYRRSGCASAERPADLDDAWTLTRAATACRLEEYTGKVLRRTQRRTHRADDATDVACSMECLRALRARDRA